MYIVVIAWFYVVALMAVVEAASSNGTLLGAFITFLLYGVLPLSIVLYIFGTPGRKRKLHASQLQERAEWETKKAEVAQASTEPDASGHASSAGDTAACTNAGDTPIAPVRKEA